METYGTNDSSINQRRTINHVEEDGESQIEFAANFLLRSRYSGIFYRDGSLAYLIPIQYNLGYKVAPLRAN